MANNPPGPLPPPGVKETIRRVRVEASLLQLIGAWSKFHRRDAYQIISLSSTGSLLKGWKVFGLVGVVATNATDRSPAAVLDEVINGGVA